jgi:hypothetical protein
MENDMSRLEHLQKAQALLGQAIEHLKRSNCPGSVTVACNLAGEEPALLDMIEDETPAEAPEPIYQQRDYDPYEEGGTLA